LGICSRSYSGGADRTELSPFESIIAGSFSKALESDLERFSGTGLSVDERYIKNGPRIKNDSVGPPKAPAVFIFLPDWQLKQ
jgi:hypothetical protein